MLGNDLELNKNTKYLKRYEILSSTSRNQTQMQEKLGFLDLPQTNQ
jgi:hypothetical protein